MKSLDSSNSRYPKLRNGVISRSAKLFVYVPISGFRRFAFQHFGTPVVKCFDTSTLGTLKWSYFPIYKTLVDVPLSGFWDSGFCNYGTPVLKSLNS
jgi:hypothetical protein